jgi:hypothetical protein
MSEEKPEQTFFLNEPSAKFSPNNQPLRPIVRGATRSRSLSCRGNHRTNMVTANARRSDFRKSVMKALLTMICSRCSLSFNPPGRHKASRQGVNCPLWLSGGSPWRLNIC